MGKGERLNTSIILVCSFSLNNQYKASSKKKNFFYSSEDCAIFHNWFYFCHPLPLQTVIKNGKKTKKWIMSFGSSFSDNSFWSEYGFLKWKQL